MYDDSEMEKFPEIVVESRENIAGNKKHRQNKILLLIGASSRDSDYKQLTVFKTECNILKWHTAKYKVVRLNVATSGLQKCCIVWPGVNEL